MPFKKNSVEVNPFELGGNYFELIEFSLIRHLRNGQVVNGRYGVNVAKVREVVHLPNINPLGSTVRGIAGIFELRGVPIPAVNLCQVLGDIEVPASSKQQVIVTEFSQKRAGFIVNSTNRIRRVAWEKVMPPSTDASSCMTGMILVENQEFLFILDLERILVSIEMEAFPDEFQPLAAPSPMMPAKPVINRNAPIVLLVDDSRLILQNVGRALLQEGFQVIPAHDGMEALEIAQDVLSGRYFRYPRIDAIVTDIEMPRLNGISLVSKLREIPQYQTIPILLHTSLDGQASKEAAKHAGASNYVVKNDIMNIIETLKPYFNQDLLSVAN